MFHFYGGEGIDVTKFLHNLPRLRGLEEANAQFLCGVALESREATRRAFLPLEEAYKLVLSAKWGGVTAHWNDDCDDHSPEGILGGESYGDPVGDRIETDSDFTMTSGSIGRLWMESCTCLAPKKANGSRTQTAATLAKRWST